MMAERDQLMDASAGLLTIRDVTRYTRLSRTTVYGLMDSGQLVYAKIGRRRLVPRKELEDLIRKSTVRRE